MDEAPTHDPGGGEISAAQLRRDAAELEALRSQTRDARDTLSGLQRDLAEAERHLSSHQSTKLLEANEQLVLALMRAHSDAETSAQMLKDVSQSAELDVLTELPNRIRMLDRFAQTIAQAKRRGVRFALFFLDLNNFKQINDTLGHAVGDEVLKMVAQRLSGAVRDADTVSRHGGDEFLVLVNEVSQASDAVLIADKIAAALSAPSRVGEHVLRLTASIGISVYPDDGEDAETLIERADAAMYRAKRHGRGSYAFHGKTPTGEQMVTAPAPASLVYPLAQPEQVLPEHEQEHALLREANEALVLAALNAQDLKAAAEAALRQQTEFLAVLAHELRNPLTPILSATALIGRVSAEELPRLQAMIERQVKHISRLLEDLLDVSRINTGKLRLERERVNVATVVDTSIHACRLAMDARLQNFTVRLPPQALYVDGDPVRLTQVVSNLLDNASKYTQDGGVIALSVETSNGSVVMTVADNGIGITAEALPRIFDAFVQDTHAIGFNGVGLGIGLAVVRELVAAHGGTVVASSAGKNQGSQFVITLPLMAGP